ncbi:MAG: hypothetical protein KDI27_01060 [Gammaproteobacteria bacterium]|nr:hypothetical protein [Gammaproteobacteria bacterium]MCP5415635.1 hypothetical protein [Chromatiaceae bacterium]
MKTFKINRKYFVARVWCAMVVMGVSAAEGAGGATTCKSLRGSSNYSEVTIEKIIRKKVKPIDVTTKKSAGRSLSADQFKSASESVQDDFGLVCLDKADGSGVVWAYGSSVKITCTPANIKLAKQSSGAGSMGFGSGDCKK